MKAAVVRSHDAPPALEDWPDPDPAAGPVGRLLAAALNPLDLLIASGRHPLRHPDPPFIAGYEAVIEDRDGARRYIAEPTPPAGTLAELIPYDSSNAFDVPHDVDPALACVLGVSGLAAWMALSDNARLAPGETVAVLGAAGQVGRLALQFADILGAGRIIAAARPAQLATLQHDRIVGAALGDGEDFSASLAAAAPDGCDVILDLLWGEAASTAVQHAANGCRFVQVGNSAQQEASISAPALRAHHVSIIGHSVVVAPLAQRRAAFSQLLGHATRIEVELERTNLADITETWTRLAAGVPHKLVVSP